MRLGKLGVFVSVLLCAAVLPGFTLAQSEKNSSTKIMRQQARQEAQKTQISPPSSEEDPALQALQRRSAKAVAKDRYQSLKRDADKLLQLATELKLYVDKTNENALSVDVVKKAEEIEKLAHSVQSKMKGQ